MKRIILIIMFFSFGLLSSMPNQNKQKQCKNSFTNIRNLKNIKKSRWTSVEKAIEQLQNKFKSGQISQKEYEDKIITLLNNAPIKEAKKPQILMKALQKK